MSSIKTEPEKIALELGYVTRPIVHVEVHTTERWRSGNGEEPFHYMAQPLNTVTPETDAHKKDAT